MLQSIRSTHRAQLIEHNRTEWAAEPGSEDRCLLYTNHLWQQSATGVRRLAGGGFNPLPSLFNTGSYHQTRLCRSCNLLRFYYCVLLLQATATSNLHSTAEGRCKEVMKFSYKVLYKQQKLSAACQIAAVIKAHMPCTMFYHNFTVINHTIMQSLPWSHYRTANSPI